MAYNIKFIQPKEKKDISRLRNVKKITSLYKMINYICYAAVNGRDTKGTFIRMFFNEDIENKDKNYTYENPYRIKSNMELLTHVVDAIRSDFKIDIKNHFKGKDYIQVDLTTNTVMEFVLATSMLRIAHEGDIKIWGVVYLHLLNIIKESSLVINYYYLLYLAFMLSYNIRYFDPNVGHTPFRNQKQMVHYDRMLNVLKNINGGALNVRLESTAYNLIFLKDILKKKTFKLSIKDQQLVTEKDYNINITKLYKKIIEWNGKKNITFTSLDQI